MDKSPVVAPTAPASDKQNQRLLELQEMKRRRIKIMLTEQDAQESNKELEKRSWVLAQRL